MIASGRAARLICSCNWSLSAARSGALSWMKSASATQACIVATKRRRDGSAPGVNPLRSSAGQAFATFARSCCSASGAGSQATTSRPWASARATQPLPMTPVPMAAKVSSWVMTVMPNALLALLALFDGVGGGGVELGAGGPWGRGAGGDGGKPPPGGVRGGGQNPGSETLDDFARTLAQRTVARMHAAIEPQIVLQANAHMPAEQHRRREHRHLHAPDAEAGPVRARRQVVNHGLHRASVCRGTPGNTEAQLKQWRIVEQTFLEQLLGEPQMPGVEYLQLGLDAERLYAFGAGAQLRGRRHVDVVAVTEVERAAIERADFRQQFLDMHQPGQPADQIGALAETHRLLTGADLQIAPHAGRQVDDDIGVGAANAVNHIAVQIRVAAATPRLRVAHMAMRHRRTGLCRLDRRRRNLLGRDGNRRVFANRITCAGDGAGDDDFMVHADGLALLAWLSGH